MESHNLLDFDVGNLFYIIAMIVAVLVSVLGKKKKPGKAFRPTGAPIGGKNNIFDLLGKELQGFVEPDQTSQDFVPEEQPEPVRIEYEEVPEPVSEEEEEVSEILRSYEEGLGSPVSDLYMDLKQNEGISSTGELQVIDLDENEGIDYFDAVKNFDLETAIIYSAVINRIDY